jgi:tetratricopeptide (TPR) repeat protein
MNKIQTLFLTIIFAAATAAAAAAQPIGPGPIGPGPIGPGPMGVGPMGLGPGAHAMRLGPVGIDANRGGALFAADNDDKDDKADDLYTDGRDAIEEGKYERALDRFNRLIDLKSNRTDAALYWKAYSLSKLGRRADALSTLTDLQQQFKDSRWLKDAKALEVELRQASGQTVAPENQVDDDTKLIVLRALMNSDPDRAIPIIEQMLAASNSPRVKDRALIVLSQSGSSRARDIIANVAKGGANPDLQLRAIKYLGIMGGDASRQVLADVYRSSNDPAVKRAIIRSFMVSGDRTRLLGLAKTETNADLRGEAVQQLGVMGAHAELSELYASETSVEVKKRIIQAMFVGGSADKLIELAKNEKDPQLRRTAVRNLGLMGSSRTADAIKQIYQQADSTPEIKKEAINALFLQNNGRMLVELARAEKDPAMKKEMIQKMSNMGKQKEVADYLMELLK